MPIAVSCPGCGDRYDLSRDLAGRRCRCKGCGTVFRVPELRAAATTAAPGPFAGLDEGPALPRDGAYAAPPRSYTASSYEPELPPPPRAPKPTRSRPRRRRREADETDPLFRIGWGLMSFSLLMLVLPMIGLQWAIVNILPPTAQAGIFGIAFFAGGVLLTASAPGAAWQRAAKALGVTLFVIVLVLVAILFGVGFWHGFNVANRPPAPVIQFQPPIPPPIMIRQIPMPNPNPNPNPMPAPAPFPRFNPPAPRPPIMPPMRHGGPGRPGRF